LCTCGQYPEAEARLNAVQAAFNSAWEVNQLLKRQVKVQLLSGPEPEFPASTLTCEACNLVAGKTQGMQAAFARVDGENDALKRLLAASKQTPVLAVTQPGVIGPPDKVGDGIIQIHARFFRQSSKLKAHIFESEDLSSL
jgi:hypothetical protein